MTTKKKKIGPSKKPKDVFRVSSALKDIIGQKLITDDFVAVFELVKNSFDANAKRVDLYFQGLETENAKLIIKDNGKGMDRTDLVEKWLFVAYSAKKEGVEDYRDKIQSRRIHAGAKGIGRFSCDRLGKGLTIYSKKNPKSSTLNKLSINWLNFEVDMKKEMDEIPVEYSTTKNNPYKITKGTALEISGLREEWNQEKFRELKRSLQKLINPNQGNDAGSFLIYLHVPEAIAKDKEVPDDEPWNIINGKVENQIFEDLGLKTTQIHTEISEDGETIKTRLEDRGSMIYEITEKNPFHVNNEALHNISVHIFALNRRARMLFTKRMGVRAIDFGSVFLYKNGFRIHPIGDVMGGDFFGLDRRKQQHGSTYLGSRDVIGRIEINGKNDVFEETTSRDGGLIKNKYYDNLVEFVVEYGVKRLEKYAIDVIKYSSPDLTELFKYRDLNRDKVFSLINSLTTSDKIISFEYNPRILDILNEFSEKSLHSILNNFKRISSETNNELLQKEVKKIERRLTQLQKEKEEAEKAENKARKEAKRAEEKAETAQQYLDIEKKKNLYLLSTRRTLSNDADGLIHTIKLNSIGVRNVVDGLLDDVSHDAIDKDGLLRQLGKIKINAEKSLKMAELVTKSNFDRDIESKNIDIVSFIREYTEQNEEKFNYECSINYKGEDIEYLRKVSVLSLSIIFDNLISNSTKWGAENILIEFSLTNNNYLRVRYNDDGSGLSQQFLKSPKQIFELGVRDNPPDNYDVEGSGIGLYFVKSLLQEMNASIKFVGNDVNLSGACFEVIFK